LNIPSILSAASVTGADAIHPGIGFLAENAAFAEIVEEHGFTFIGPAPEHIRTMGDKVSAKLAAIQAGIPVVPGSKGVLSGLEEAAAVAADIGYPVLVKASGGGGGKGMKVAWSATELPQAFALAQSEALACFGNGAVYMEKYLSQPRHIEIQILGDRHGNCIHLGERDCSLQRRHQKVLEEAPSPVLSAAERAYVGDLASAACRKLGYYSAGTFEFLYENGKFYFIEMNTRLQVEHPVTEMITGVDLVKEQIRVAAGLELNYRQEDITFTGHAIECRINAEHPETFIPSPGKITEYHAPGGPGIRVDSALYAGYSVPPHYDSLVAKLIAHAPTRAECLTRLDRALKEYAILGIHTNIPLHQQLVRDRTIIDSAYSIHWLEEFVEVMKKAAE
jgi:acetyl-CoA carboxylase biotin carboxylase subunit